MDISYKKSELQVALEEARASSNCIVHNHDIQFMEVQNYFALADIVILPYQEGTTSGVLKLALAFGKPVVATDVGDLAEAVKEGVGILLPVKFKLSDLALAVNEIKENYDSYADACELAKERYDWGKIGKGYAHFLLDPIPKNAVSSEKG
jgi:glycosyltransferase involved in cell wall biosynthesis